MSMNHELCMSIKELYYQINVILILIFVLYCIKSCFVKKNNTF